MIYVLDACSMIAFFQKEEGFKDVEVILRTNPAKNILIHKCTVFEIYYDALRSGGSQLAEDVLQQIHALPISVVSNLDDAFMKSFSRFKANFKISYADCFVLALAELHEATVVTSDHHEFDAIEKGRRCALPLDSIVP